MFIEIVGITVLGTVASALAIARRGLRRRDVAITEYRTQLVVSERYLREIKAAITRDGGVAQHIAHTRHIARDLAQFGATFLERSPDTAMRLIEIDRYLQALGVTVGLPRQAAASAQDTTFDRTYAPLTRYVSRGTNWSGSL